MDKRFDVNLFDNKHNANDSLALDINFTKIFVSILASLFQCEIITTLIESINKEYFMRHFIFD